MEAASRLKLWELSEELDIIGAAIAEAGGEVTPEIEAALEEMEGAFDVKVERVALFVRECEANARAAKDEAERLAATERRFLAQARGLKRYMQQQMERADRPRVATHRVTVRLQANSAPSIRWTRPVEEAPEMFRRTETKTVINLDAAHQQLKHGAPLPDGFTVEHGRHVRIL